MNILLIHSHDTGRYLQPYGHAVPTPRLQRLAEEGVLFRQAFCAAPTCSPSRASMLTGQWPHNTGMLGLAHAGFSLRDYSRHLVHTLKASGYVTALSGIQHIDGPTEDVGRYASRIGYDLLLDRGDMTGPWEHPRNVDRAVEFLGRPPREPFFLDVGLMETHRGFPRPGPEDDARYTLPPAPLPDTAANRADMAAYKASARVLDEKVRRVLDALEASGRAEETLVIYTTDHGICFPAMKCNLTDHGLGVALIMRGPGGLRGGRVVDAMVSQVDLFPTICELAGVKPPGWLEGVSMVDAALGRKAEVREELFGEVTYHAAYEPQRCVRTKRWKYIRYFDPRPHPVLPNTGDSPSKTTWLEHGWREHGQSAEHLFDLVFDPNEACNLAGDAGHVGVLSEMRGRLERWMVRTGDPLLAGPVPEPEGGMHNRVDQLSPREPVVVRGSGRVTHRL